MTEQAETIGDSDFEGGRWVRFRQGTSPWLQLIDRHRPAPRLEEAIRLADDFLVAPHAEARRDAFLIECTDAAQRLVNVVKDPDGEDVTAFIADFLAMLVLEIARSRAFAVLGEQP